MGAGDQRARKGVNVVVDTVSATTGTVVLSNAHGFTFGMQTSNGSYVVTATAGVSQAVRSISGGTTRITSGTVVLGSAGGIGFGVSGSTITAAPNRVSYWDNNAWMSSGLASGSQWSDSTIQFPIGVLFQRTEVVAPILATKAAFLFGNASSRLFYVTCPMTWGVTPGQYLIGVAFATSRTTHNTFTHSLNLGIYSMTGSTAHLLTSASVSFEMASSFLWGYHLAESSLGAPGGVTYEHYFADGTFTDNVLPTSTVHLTEIRQTIAYSNTSVGPPPSGVFPAFGVPYLQLVGS